MKALSKQSKLSKYLKEGCFGTSRDFGESLDLDSIRSNGYSFQIEVSFKAWLKDFRIREIPIVFVERLHGHSKFSKKIIWEAVFMVLHLGLRSIPFRLTRLFGMK